MTSRKNAYQQGRNTESAIYQLVNEVSASLNTGQRTGAIKLDLNSAFASELQSYKELVHVVYHWNYWGHTWKIDIRRFRLKTISRSRWRLRGVSHRALSLDLFFSSFLWMMSLNLWISTWLCMQMMHQLSTEDLKNSPVDTLVKLQNWFHRKTLKFIVEKTEIMRFTVDWYIHNRMGFRYNRI